MKAHTYGAHPRSGGAIFDGRGAATAPAPADRRMNLPSKAEQFNQTGPAASPPAQDPGSERGGLSEAGRPPTHSCPETACRHSKKPLTIWSYSGVTLACSLEEAREREVEGSIRSGDNQEHGPEGVRFLPLDVIDPDDVLVAEFCAFFSTRTKPGTWSCRAFWSSSSFSTSSGVATLPKIRRRRKPAWGRPFQAHQDSGLLIACLGRLAAPGRRKVDGRRIPFRRGGACRRRVDDRRGRLAGSVVLSERMGQAGGGQTATTPAVTNTWSRHCMTSFSLCCDRRTSTSVGSPPGVCARYRRLGLAGSRRTPSPGEPHRSGPALFR